MSGKKPAKKHLNIISELSATNSGIPPSNSGLDEQTIKYALANLPMGVALLRDGKMFWTNARTRSLLGYCEEELLGKTSSFLYANEQDYIRVGRELYDGLQENEIREAEAQHICKDGTFIHLAIHASILDSSTSPPTHLVAISDITERNNALEHLQSERDLITTLFEASPAFIVAISADDGSVAMINESMLEALGYQREEVLGKNYQKIFALEDELEMLNGVLNTLRVENKPTINESHSVAKDGRKILVEWHGRPLFKPDGSVEYFLGIGVDITERRKTEEELILKQNIIQSTSSAIASTDLNLLLTDGNPAFKKAWGLDQPEEYIGKHVTEYWDVIEQLDEIKNSLKEKGTWLGNTQAIRKDGSRFDVQIMGSVVYNKAGETVGYTSTSIDVTERNRSETALRESEEKYRVLFEKAVYATSIVEDNCFTDCNQSALELLGLDEKNDLIGKSTLTISPEFQPDGRRSDEKTKEVIDRAFREGSSLFEWEHIRPDGVLVPAEVLLTMIQTNDKQIIYAIWRDLSARKKAEAELRESEETFRALAENSFDVIMRFDRQKRHIYVNPTVEKEIDIPWREFIGKTHEELGFPPDMVAICDEAIEQVFSSGKTKRVELQLPNERWVDWVLIPEFDEKGEVTAVMTSSRDLTDRKRDEAEKTQLEEQLRQLQKMESIGMLAGGVAHDFNNMLTPILGYTEIAMMELDKKNPLYKEIEEIHRAAERASALTRQLLAFGRKQVLDLRVINLNNTVHDFSRMIKRLIGENVELSINVDPALGNVKADKDQVQQILMNLAVNSRDAMPEGGVLSILTTNSELDQQYSNTHPQVNPGPYVMLSVSDNGHGMDGTTRSHIFEPFFSTKERDKGSGLGLSTVYGIVRQHGGHISVYSEPGQGTTFKVFLPRVDIQQSADATESKKTTISAGNETILVAEDEKMVRELASRVLRKNGYDVIEATSAEQALLTVKSHNPKIQLLLSDVIMPGMNGRELYRKLVLIYPDLKVLYTSGYTDDVIAEHGVLDEGIHFLQKPFTIKNLLVKVRETLDA